MSNSVSPSKSRIAREKSVQHRSRSKSTARCGHYIGCVARDVSWRSESTLKLQECVSPWRDKSTTRESSRSDDPPVKQTKQTLPSSPVKQTLLSSLEEGERVAGKVSWRGNSTTKESLRSDESADHGTIGTSSADEISKIVTTMNNHLHKAPTRSPTRKPWTICQVPNHLRNIHEYGFHPKLISIGPFHRHQPHLAAMEEHKTRFLLRLLNSMKLNTRKITTTLVDQPESSNQAVTKKKEFLVVAMNELQGNAKACYSPEISDDSYSPDDFVMMLILDGCFVVELLRLYAKCDKENDDPIFSTRWMLPILEHDLLLFENQLPYFVLEKIFDITSSEEEKKESSSLAQLALNFFDPLLPRENKLLEKGIFDAAKPDHLLGLFRSSFLSFFKDKKSSIHQVDHSSTTSNVAIIDVPLPRPAVKKRKLINCVSELTEAGIMFRKRENHDLLDIEFKNGILYIPPLSIDDYTGPVFLNFIAYEQCNINAEPYFTHYFSLFDSLVNSSKDVEHLHYRGIIDHVLGNDEDVADLFNKLCKNVVNDVNNCYLSQVSKDVNRHFRIKRHRWWAKWKHDYFLNPWAFLAFLGAIIILLLAVVQSFFTVFAYFLPPSK